ncbi:MAG: alanine--tRNA ligase [Armatimonadetes bacterium]|nr:alanine--tRNA ligase [Armatimonadota bacterium]
MRESFLAFFEEKDHLRLPSSSLIPVNDPTLLLIGAGMAPFKSYFRGEEKPPHVRITTCQKCVRADDSNVGVTARHHTFFEMLGNFSFGDYFKKESIEWAWEYLTERLNLDPNRLWVTIYPGDMVAFNHWNKDVGVPAERISELEDNFWGPIGATGPCGPCSEIYYDRGEGPWWCGRTECAPGCNCDRYLEIWNLVFTGLNKEEDGSFSDLPRPCIDTGAGLDRITFLMQGKNNPYETDAFQPAMLALKEFSGHTLDEGGRVALALKIIGDHTRAVIFLLADGISPSNEGRGYVLRRLLRRAMRFGRVLGIHGTFLEKLVPAFVAVYGEIYPELATRELHVTNVLIQEQQNFLRTLEQGEHLLQSLLQASTPLSGTDVFRLYDTYGFPHELTQEIAAERGIQIDLDGFHKALEEARERSRADLEKKLDDARGGTIAVSHEQPSEFLGYQRTGAHAHVVHLFRQGMEVDEAHEGEGASVILDRTPFYAEGGGQVGDTGIFKSGELLVEVLDTQKGPHDTIVHRVEIRRGSLKKGAELEAIVDAKRRGDIMRHHTATHLLQAALRTVVGAHITQTGSLVAPDRLRFDFSHYAPLTPEQIETVERLVNEEVLRNQAVDKREMSMSEATAAGALAFFEEKYADRVRVVTVENFSKELCGGTHCARTGDIGLFKITSESAIAAGQRRIEAVCGMVALEAVRTYENILKTVSQDLKTTPTEIPGSLSRLKESLKRTERQVEELGEKLSAQRAGDLVSESVEVGGVKLLATEVPGVTSDGLSRLGDQLRDKLQSGIVLLGTRNGEGAKLMCWVTKDLVGRGYSAGNVIKAVIPTIGGKGGGRPEFAQGGGNKPDALSQALTEAKSLISRQAEG